MSCLQTGAKWPSHDMSMIYSDSAKGKPKDKYQIQFNIPPGTSKTGGNRVFLNELSLFMYHIVFSSMIQLPDSNMPLAKKMLEFKLKEYPNSFIFLTLEARMEQSMCNPALADTQYTRVIGLQKDWRNLVHICFWDLGLCKAAQGKWLEAADCFDTLSKESKWSPAVYAYLKAVCLYHADPETYAKEIGELMTSISGLTRKIAGKSIPLEVTFGHGTQN